jgi:hypothetical protein
MRRDRPRVPPVTAGLAGDIVTGHCRLPLLLKSGNSTKGDLRNPADFQRFLATAATVRNCRFPYGLLSRGGEGEVQTIFLVACAADTSAGCADVTRNLRAVACGGDGRARGQGREGPAEA